MSTELESLLQREIARERAARKAAEQLLEDKSLELYQRNTELKAHAEALRRSNEELEQFAYVSSHDLQAPLRSIISFTQLLVRRCKDQLGEEGLEYLAYVEKSGLQMHHLILDLLEFSRAGRVALKMAPTQIRSVVDAACTQLQASIQETKAEISIGPMPELVANGDALARVFQNLIANAIKFQPRGVERPPKVDITAVEGHQRWKFAVRDNGIGIAPEHVPKLFAIFTRLHTQEEYEGTGVGLPICKKLIEQHGGRIWLESKPGEGTTFYFTLAKQPPTA